MLGGDAPRSHDARVPLGRPSEHGGPHRPVGCAEGVHRQLLEEAAVLRPVHIVRQPAQQVRGQKSEQAAESQQVRGYRKVKKAQCWSCESNTYSRQLLEEAVRSAEGCTLRSPASLRMCGEAEA